MDRDLIVRSWDGWLGDVTGVAESDANGRYLADLFPDVETRGFIARLRRVVESGAVEVLAPAFHQYLIPCPPPHTFRALQPDAAARHDVPAQGA